MRGWEKIEGLIEKMRKELEIEKRKEEMRQAFIEQYGIEPENLTIDKAFAQFRDSELPEHIRHKIYDLLNDLGIYYDYFEISLIAMREDGVDQDWDIVAVYDIHMSCRKDNIYYQVSIKPIEEKEDC